MAIQSQNKKTGHGENLSSASALRDCLDGGVIVVDRQQQIIACTPEAERLLRLRLDQSSARCLTQLPAALRRIIREAAASRKPKTAQTMTLLPAGSAPTRLRVSVLPLRIENNRRDVVVMLNNLGATERIKQNLTRLDRLANLGTLSASMAHEIKNALVSVKTFVDLLLEKNRDDELAEVVSREMRRIDSIVGQMLKYAGPSRRAFSAVRLHDVLDHSLRMVQPHIEGKLISLNRAFNAIPDAVKGDDYQLEQAFVNLLLNAIEAMGPNGSLTVATDLASANPARPKAASTSGTQVRIAIADTGIGITTENMNRLFEPFFTTKEHGTGLGLAIARRIVREHHGDITVQSQVNKGTTFSILFPIHAQTR